MSPAIAKRILRQAAAPLGLSSSEIEIDDLPPSVVLGWCSEARDRGLSKAERDRYLDRKFRELKAMAGRNGAP